MTSLRAFWFGFCRGLALPAYIVVTLAYSPIAAFKEWLQDNEILWRSRGA